MNTSLIYQALLAFCLLRLSVCECGMDDHDLKRIDGFIQAVENRRPISPDVLNGLADVDYSSVKRALAEYVAFEEPDREVHLRYQSFLERVTRSALAPWPLLQLYSKPFATSLVRAADDDEAQRLLVQLFSSGLQLQPYRLAVRLVPASSLDFIARQSDSRHASALLESWISRLHTGQETRPIPNLGKLLDACASRWNINEPVTLLRKRLMFLGGWPQLHARYEAALSACLQHENADIVVAGIHVQQRFPRLLSLNEAIVRRFNAKTAPRNEGRDDLLASALANFAFESKTDYSPTLRRIWNATLTPDMRKARHACLFAMGIHHRGNDVIALQVVKETLHEFIDVATPILSSGDPQRAAEAIRLILENTERGNEEAFRLAETLKLTGFEEHALKAINGREELILRQSAMHYLKCMDGSYRLKCHPLMADSSSDIRLAAIQMMGSLEGLTKQQQNEIGPGLIRVALSDESEGHRQEAMFALGRWGSADARPFFEKMVEENAVRALTLSQHHYWPYRYYLMGLLGLARLNDEQAVRRLLDIHSRGGPMARMDVLLAFMDLGRVPSVAFDDLKSTEPKLVATAAKLIRTKGSDEQRAQMLERFHRSPMWLLFSHSGIDDHNILKYSGLRGD